MDHSLTSCITLGLTKEIASTSRILNSTLGPSRAVFLLTGTGLVELCVTSYHIWHGNDLVDLIEAVNGF